LRKAVWASAICLLLGSFAGSATTLLTGTPNNSDNSTDTPTGLTPKFGTLINFDSLTPNSILASNAFAGSGISSIADTNGTAPLSAMPYSSQSYPNYIGTADFSNIDTRITLNNSTNQIGVGLLAGQSNSFSLLAYGASNNLLGSYTVNVPSDGVNAYNGYYAISDTTADIKSLEVIGNGGFDDVQFNTVPEIDANSCTGALGLLSGALLIFRGKRKATA
jgi:hypothetical protein